jgi:hypothetical protein
MKLRESVSIRSAYALVRGLRYSQPIGVDDIGDWKLSFNKLRTTHPRGAADGRRSEGYGSNWADTSFLTDLRGHTDGDPGAEDGFAPSLTA